MCVCVCVRQLRIPDFKNRCAWLYIILRTENYHVTILVGTTSVYGFQMSIPSLNTCLRLKMCYNLRVRGNQSFSGLGVRESIMSIWCACWDQKCQVKCVCVCQMLLPPIPQSYGWPLILSTQRDKRLMEEWGSNIKTFPWHVLLILPPHTASFSLLPHPLLSPPAPPLSLIILSWWYFHKHLLMPQQV